LNFREPFTASDNPSAPSNSIKYSSIDEGDEPIADSGQKDHGNDPIAGDHQNEKGGGYWSQ